MKHIASLLRPLAIAGSAALTFVAPACGTPDEDDPAAGAEGNGAAWVGKTYLLRTTAGDWITPRGIGAEIGPYVPGFLLRVDSANGTEVGVTIATVPAAGPDMQDTCTATKLVAAQSPAPGSLTIGPLDYVMYLVNLDYAVHATVYGLKFENVLDAEGTLTATLDFRELAHLLTVLTQPDAEEACRALENSGGVQNAMCQPCPDGQPYCLTIVANPVTATEFAGTVMDIPMSTCMEKLRETTPPSGTAPAPSTTAAPAATP